MRFLLVFLLLGASALSVAAAPPDESMVVEATDNSYVVADISAPDDLWEKTKPNNMWARSFVRLLRDMVNVIRGGTPDGEPATFRDGWQIQRVLDAIRGGRGVQLD